MPINSRAKGARLMEETWRPIVGYEGRYEISNFGNVRSLPKYHRKHSVLLKPYQNPRHGYTEVRLTKDGKSKTRRLHKLVLEAFTDYRSKGYVLYQEIDHIDGNKANNHLINLEVVTHKENMRRASAKGLRHFTGVRCIDLDTHIVYDTYQSASRAIGGKRGEMVRRVCDGERSHYRNHRFARYEDYINGNIPSYKGTRKRKASESLWVK